RAWPFARRPPISAAPCPRRIRERSVLCVEVRWILDETIANRVSDSDRHAKPRIRAARDNDRDRVRQLALPRLKPRDGICSAGTRRCEATTRVDDRHRGVFRRKHGTANIQTMSRAIEYKHTELNRCRRRESSAATDQLLAVDRDLDRRRLRDARRI